jgi:hypothetical protein
MDSYPLSIFYFIKMESKEVILKIYKAILNGEVEVSDVKQGWGNGMILHFQPVENSNFEKFVFNYKDEMNKISLNKFKENYKNYQKNEPEVKQKKYAERKHTYILVNKANNRYKIGESINPKGRLITLRSEEPEIEFLYSCKSTIVSESQLHNEFKNKRHIGEWFNLEENDLLKIKKMMQL